MRGRGLLPRQAYDFINNCPAHTHLAIAQGFERVVCVLWGSLPYMYVHTQTGGCFVRRWPKADPLPRNLHVHMYVHTYADRRTPRARETELSARELHPIPEERERPKNRMICTLHTAGYK